MSDDLLTRVRAAASDKALDIGTAWNLLQECAEAMGRSCDHDWEKMSGWGENIYAGIYVCRLCGKYENWQ